MLRTLTVSLPLLLAPWVTGCAIIPGSTYVPPHQRVASPYVAYYDPNVPDKTGSHLLGVPKAHPAWWIENTDEPLADWWKPELPYAERRRTWLLRNPLHNFTNYVIGVADRPTKRYGLNAHSVWNHAGPVNLAVTQSGPVLWLPFISWKGWLTEGYFGWREKGNFGATLRRRGGPRPDPPVLTPPPSQMPVPDLGPSLGPDEGVPVLRGVPANP